jgi:aryl-alcohol dehydrogenase-like predicted oxidoreductase
MSIDRHSVDTSTQASGELEMNYSFAGESTLAEDDVCDHDETDVRRHHHRHRPGWAAAREAIVCSGVGTDSDDVRRARVFCRVSVRHVPIPTGRLGSTQLVVSRLGLGLAALGRPAYITLGRQRDFGPDRSVSELERRCHEMLDAAYAAGIRYVDAARSYGMAETFLGTWLKARNPATDAIIVGSKWGYTYVGSWRLDASVHEVKDLSVDTLQRQIVESRALIGDRLQLYQIHSATLESKVLENVDVLRELLRLHASGLVIGLTVTGPNQADVIRRALRVSIDGVNPFQVVQATWNLLERSAGAALAEAKARGWGVIVKEALANGRLTDRANGALVRALKIEAVARRTTIDALALAAALSQPWVDVVLSGAVTVAQLESNLTAMAFEPKPTDWSDIAELPTDYWARRSALAWQ